jgi:hypothetical protein
MPPGRMPRPSRIPLRVLAELSDAPGAILVHAAHDQTRGWQWVTEPL